MNIVVISLERSTRRREAMAAELAKAGLAAEWFAAVDGAAADARSDIRFDQRRSERVRGLALSPGERGAAASHVALWRRCVDRNEPLVIMEDDILLGPGLPAALGAVAQRLDRYGLIRFFMFFPRRHRVEETIGEWQIARYWRGGTGLQCYAIAPAAAAALVSRASPMIFPVDLYLERFWEHGVIPYAVHPFAVGIRDYGEFPSEIGYRQARQRRLGTRLVREIFRARDDARRVLFNAVHR